MKSNKLLNKYFIFDIEGDGLLDNITKLHCLSIGWIDKNGNFKIKSTTDYEEMRRFFSDDSLIKIGHNIINFDCRAVEKVLGIKINNNTVIDTLALSWYLFPTLKKHGLEEWGEYFGIQKPEIDDWQNLTSKEYIYRCEEDVKINFKLWKKELKELELVYDFSYDDMESIIDYLQYKLFCIKEQEENPLRFDNLKAVKLLDDLKKEKELKVDALKKIMPKVIIKEIKKIKNVIKISEDEYYTEGDLLFDYYKLNGYKIEPELIIEKIKNYKEPNPDSPNQKKDWLYSLGWIPETFKYEKEENGSQRKIPQIMSDKKDGSFCNSVTKLYSKEPGLEILEGLSILTHRIGLIEGLLKIQNNGFIEASSFGFTNTLRLRHKNFVNLPGFDKKYGKEIRGLFIAREGDLLCGSDMSSLEDSTKQHFIYFHDPKYVIEMRTPGFDPHLDIGILGNIITQEESDFYKDYEGKSKEEEFKPSLENKKRYNDIKKKRYTSKTTNFSATYGAGAPKIAQTGNISLKLAKDLHKIYWIRNKAVKQTAENTIVKTINNQKWQYNPVSKFWYSLRAEKDRFSTLNQGTADFCFTTWLKEVRNNGIIVNMQYHDEILFNILGKEKSEIKTILDKCIDNTNNILKLNIPLAISYSFDNNYADCH